MGTEGRLSFDAETKQMFMDRARFHQEADEIIQGQYWRDGKGCAVGCLVHSANHHLLAIEMGIPVELIWLLDTLFEGMYLEDAKGFPLRFVEAVPVKSDLRPIMLRWLITLLTHSRRGLRVITASMAGEKERIDELAGTLTQRLEGKGLVVWPPPTNDEQRSWALRAAYYAAGYDLSPEDKLNRIVAGYDSEPNRLAVRDASYYAAAAWAGRGSPPSPEHYRWQAETLLSLLKGEAVP